jgi:16S rRNA (guanine1207-N2)-methyltransferase
MTNEHYFSAKPATELIPREITVELDGSTRTVITSGGIFSPDHIDTGTKVLLANTPQAPPGGNLLDLGCGWGPIALTLALQSPHAVVWAVDVNERALDLVNRNAARLGLDNIRTARPDEVPADLEFLTIWSNPPIRIGKVELHNLLTTWLPRLEPGSDAWLVVQRNLGADSLHRWLESEFPNDFVFSREALSKGFRILKARHLESARES